MKKLTSIFVFIFLCGELSFSQRIQDTIDCKQLLKYKVDENRFEFGWLDNVFSGIPCFRDYTKSEIQMSMVDTRTDSIIYKSSETKENGLVIIPQQFLLERNTKHFQLKGQITGGWESVKPFEFEIYIGHRNDTVSNITLSPSEYGDVYFGGVKVDSTIVVEVVPAFYLSNIVKFKAFRGDRKLDNSDFKEILFDVDAIIDEKSILVFGLSSGYSEIFEIGKLLY